MKTYFIRTFGCQMNLSDSERIAGFLTGQGLKKTTGAEKADLVVINGCGIRQSAENKAYGAIAKIKKQNSEVTIVLTGCLGHRTDVKKRVARTKTLVSSIDQVIPLLEKLLKKRDKPETEFALTDFFGIRPECDLNFSASIPIMTGCNNFCSYCVVPYARGREVSRDPREILKEARYFAQKGFKEITLLGQNVNSYSYQKKGRSWNFPRLLKAVAKVKGDFWLRFMTSHPKDFSTELLETIATEPKIAKQIHLPLQSGSDQVLLSMNRRYTAKDYWKLTTAIKKRLPEASLTTDIIVGFPTETKADFLKTKSLMTKIGFDMAYISRYSPRPQTAAGKLTMAVLEEEKIKRRAVLNRLIGQTALKNNQHLIGQILTVLVRGKNPDKTAWGETEQKKKIRLTGKNVSRADIGQFCRVKVTGAVLFGLLGEPI